MSSLAQTLDQTAPELVDQAPGTEPRELFSSQSSLIAYALKTYKGIKGRAYIHLANKLWYSPDDGKQLQGFVMDGYQEIQDIAAACGDETNWTRYRDAVADLEAEGEIEVERYQDGRGKTCIKSIRLLRFVTKSNQAASFTTNEPPSFTTNEALHSPRMNYKGKSSKAFTPAGSAGAAPLEPGLVFEHPTYGLLQLGAKSELPGDDPEWYLYCRNQPDERWFAAGGPERAGQFGLLVPEWKLNLRRDQLRPGTAFAPEEHLSCPI